MWQVMGIDTSSTEVVVVAQAASKRHIKTTSGSLLHAREVALTDRVETPYKNHL
jgi:hypothetical protein